MWKISVYIIIFLFLLSPSFSQTNTITSLKKEFYLKELTTLNSKIAQTPKKGIGNGMLTFYQKHVSVLISADCFYSLSCSRFSREAINKYGFLPGLFLTADRLTRCNFICIKDIPDTKFNKNGLAEDHP